MRLDEVEPWDPRPVLREERGELLDLLGDLSPEEWTVPTEAGHWRVKDVALHLLDDDLGWLSRGRDGDESGLLPTDGYYREFVRALDAKNDRWVLSTGGLSPRVITDLLAWSGAEVEEFFTTVDLYEGSDVIWAAGSDVPRWFDLARDLTERPPAAHPRRGRTAGRARSVPAAGVAHLRVGLPAPVRRRSAPRERGRGRPRCRRVVAADPG